MRALSRLRPELGLPRQAQSTPVAGAKPPGVGRGPELAPSTRPARPGARLVVVAVTAQLVATGDRRSARRSFAPGRCPRQYCQLRLRQGVIATIGWNVLQG